MDGNAIKQIVLETVLTDIRQVQRNHFGPKAVRDHKAVTCRHEVNIPLFICVKCGCTAEDLLFARYCAAGCN